MQKGVVQINEAHLLHLGGGGGFPEKHKLQ